MQCPKCSSEVYDNRAKKAAGTYKANAPDFACQNKACDWKQWPPKAQASPVPLSAPPSAPQAHGNGSRDAQLVALYWTCFDEVLAGLKHRTLTAGFPGSEIAACVATMFIARSKIL